MSESVLLAAIGVVAAATAVAWVCIYQLARQHGRLLLRLDELEHRLAQTAPAAPTPEQLIAAGLDPMPAPAERPALRRRPLSLSRIERDGLKPGTPAPVFELPEVRGGTVALDAYRGRPVLLVFTDPHCGPCEALAPRLARLHQQQGDAGPALVMISRGDPAENRAKAEAYGFTFPIALQQRWEISRKYGIFATPVAFLVDEAGVIVKDVARGMDDVLALAREALGSDREGSHEQAVR